MKTMTVSEYHQAWKSQGVKRSEDIALVCPMCATVQTAADLIAAGAGKDFDQVKGYLGFSCVGRFTGAPGPRKQPDGNACNWTLGGLFEFHKLEVITEDGKHHPSFEPATPEQVKQHVTGCRT